MAESPKITRLRGEEPKQKPARVIYLVHEDLAQAEAAHLERDLKRVLGQSYWRELADGHQVRFQMLVPTREELQGG